MWTPEEEDAFYEELNELHGELLDSILQNGINTVLVVVGFGVAWVALMELLTHGPDYFLEK
tara:strand:- start:7023 stop:7205 length:183 start_codon:yes stop_codon:yes gene_type:complete